MFLGIFLKELFKRSHINWSIDIHLIQGILIREAFVLLVI